MTNQDTNKDNNFQIFAGTTRSQFCVLGYIQGFENDFKLMKGISVEKDWPEKVSIRMDPDFKTQIKLSDNLYNQNNVVVASKRLCELFQTEKVQNVEYLPIQIINHKKRIESAPYWIVHPVTTQDCIDRKESELDWNAINPEDICSVKKLVLDPSKIAENALLFRAKHLKTAVFIRRDLAGRLQTAGFTGIVFKDTAAFRC